MLVSAAAVSDSYLVMSPRQPCLETFCDRESKDTAAKSCIAEYIFSI
jgi:hypothetical protein